MLIAFFGGLVGVIAITRVEKGNPIPGVAIATALMPPLCTAGYGIAIGNWPYFFGAIYLYTINCFFICIATFVLVKYLKYPVLKHIDPVHEKRIKYGISSLILLMIIPSFYLAYNLYIEKGFDQRIERYINEELVSKGYTVIYKKTTFDADPKKIELACLEKFREEEVVRLNENLKYYDIENTKLVIRQDTSDLKNDILNEIGHNQIVLNEKDVIIKKLQQELLNNKLENTQVLNECRILFPEIRNLSLAKHTFNENTDSSKVVGVMIYDSVNELDSITSTKMGSWLKSKLGMSDMELYRQK